MSHKLISHSPDLQRLRNEGYDVEIRSNHLLIKNVPYVNALREVKRGILVSELTLAGDRTTTPGTHVAMFSGEYPCNKDGSPIAQLRHGSNSQQIDRDLVVHHSFSNNPAEGYKNYYDKMVTYATIISSPARSMDPSATPQTFPIIETSEEESVFKYLDTASSRAGITSVTQALEIGKIAIVGLGGTGSYVLDLVAKTPVKEIYLFDGDKFLQHNAFRSPGAPSIDELRKEQMKVTYLSERYSNMRRNIFAVASFVDASNVDQLKGMDFVFLCVDKGGAKKLIVEKLEPWGIPFIDVGMGIEQVDKSLLGVLRVTTSTAKHRGHVRAKNRIAFSDGVEDDEYSQNIQIADLNALNASLAVIKWKKLFGFYQDTEKEYHSTYSINCNLLTSEDQTLEA